MLRAGTLEPTGRKDFPKTAARGFQAANEAIVLRDFGALVLALDRRIQGFSATLLAMSGG